MKILFFSAMIVWLTTCNSATPPPDELQTVSFMPTSCSEPWDDTPYTDGGGNRSSRMLAYLKDKGIADVYNFKSETDDKAYCQACNCLSGETFSFSVSADDYQKLKTIPPFSGFL